MNNATGGGSLVLDVYKCCSCLKVPEGQIYNCKKCHPLCLNCYANGDKCPKCKDKLPVKRKIRNEHMEEMLDGLEFDCEFSGGGCKEKLPRQMLSRHFKTCRYRVRSELQNDMSAQTVGEPSIVVKQEEISSVLQSSCQGSSTTSDKSSMPVIEMNEAEDDCRIVDADKQNSLKEPEEIILSDDDGETTTENNSTISGTAPSRSSSQCGMERQSQENICADNQENVTTASKIKTEDDDENKIEGRTITSNAEEDSANPEAASSSTCRVSRKRKISETEDPNDAKDTEKAELKDKVFDTFSFSTVQILKMIEAPELMEQYTQCKIAFTDEMSSIKILKVLELFHESGNEFFELLVNIPYSEENFRFLEEVLQRVPNIWKLIYHYQHGQDAMKFLTALKVGKEKGNFPSLTCLKLVGASGKESLRNEHITKLFEVGIKFRILEIGDSLWEDVKAETVRKLMENCKDSLKYLIIYGGFRGRSDKTQRVLTFPKMTVLNTLWLCPYYSFLPEFPNPLCKTSRIVEPDSEEEEPIKVTVKFQDSFPSLKFLALGNLVEVEDLYFSTIRKLTRFLCGSSWNLSVQFPPEFCRKSLFQSNVTDFKFPDNLKDPSFPEKIAKYFRKLKRVRLNLPSMAVLQASFKAFENSSVERLYLITQFDFAYQLESCLFPGLISTMVRNQAEETKSLIKMLKEYKHFKEYAAYHNLDLPFEQKKDKSEIISPGIAGLKNLKVLRIQHIPRNLLIPVIDEEKKWYDHKCKFINTTFGFRNYPLTYECHHEILKLNLEEYYPTRMICQATGEFYEGINKNAKEASKANEELFNLGKNNVRSSAQVKIERSLGLLDSDIKSESV